MLALPAEKGTKGSLIGNAIGKTSVSFIVCIQYGVTIHERFVSHGISSKDLRMLFVFEFGFGKLRSRIESGPYPDGFSSDFLACFHECFYNKGKIPVGK